MFTRTMKKAAAETSTTERAAANAASTPIRVRSENRPVPRTGRRRVGIAKPIGHGGVSRKA